MAKEKLLYLSPSSANLYLTCPRLYQNKKVYDNKTDMMNFGSWIHKCLEQYLKSNKVKNILAIAKNTFMDYNIGMDDYLVGKTILENWLKREYLLHPVLGSELALEDILPNGIALRGYADLVVERDKDTIEVIDYKSGLKYYSASSLNYNIQLKIYKNLILHNPKYLSYKNVILTIDQLRYDPISIIQDEIDNQSFLDFIEELYLKIVKDKEFKPNFPNSFCKSCIVTNLCPEYKDLLKYDFKIQKSNNEKAEHFFELKKIKTIIDNDIDFYKDFFTTTLSREKNNFIKCGDYTVGISKDRLYVNLGRERKNGNK